MFGMNEIEKRIKQSDAIFHQRKIQERLNSLIGKSVIVDLIRVHNYAHFFVSGKLQGPFEGKYMVSPTDSAYVSFHPFSVEEVIIGDENHINIEI